MFMIRGNKIRHYSGDTPKVAEVMRIQRTLGTSWLRREFSVAVSLPDRLARREAF